MEMKQLDKFFFLGGEIMTNILFSHQVSIAFGALLCGGLCSWNGPKSLGFFSTNSRRRGSLIKKCRPETESL